MSRLAIINRTTACSYPVPDCGAFAAALIDLVPTPKHARLIHAVNQLSGGVVFRLALCSTERGYHDGRILAPDDSEVATDARTWLRHQLAELDGDTRKLRQRCEELRVRRTSVQLGFLYLVADIGPRPEDFVQLEIDVCTEYPALRPFGEDWDDRSASELLDCRATDESCAPVSPPRYRFRRCEVISEFLAREAALHRAAATDRIANLHRRAVTEIDRERGTQTARSFFDAFPEVPCTSGPSPLQRLFADWAESSAGRSGARFCDHWVLKLHEGQWQGKEYCSAIPAWTIRKKLPDWHKAKIRSVPRLVEWLESFDKKAGHPFAWYFYMLHGNRISQRAGLAIASATHRGLTWLPHSDRTVLLRYAESPFGF